MKRLALLLLVCAGACKTSAGDFKDVPCQDKSELMTSEGKPIECHPQASIETSPVGSAGVVLVTCRCNLLPEPCACDLPTDFRPETDGGAGD